MPETTPGAVEGCCQPTPGVRTKKRPDGESGRAKRSGDEGLVNDLRGAGSAARRHDRGDDRSLRRLDYLAPCGGARQVARLDHETFFQGRVNAGFDVVRLLPH